MRNLIIGLVVIGVALAAFLYLRPTQEVSSDKTYRSETYGISFTYPAKYFVQEMSTTGERIQATIVLMEDTPENRGLAAGNLSDGRGGPPTITIGIYQNNLDKYTAESFIRGTNFSNFKLSDGILTPYAVGGLSGFAYHASGLYENENVAVAQPEFVYIGASWRRCSSAALSTRPPLQTTRHPDPSTISLCHLPSRR